LAAKIADCQRAAALNEARQAVANGADRLRQLNEGLKGAGLMDRPFSPCDKPVFALR
jgi:hypothetical protein